MFLDNECMQYIAEESNPVCYDERRKTVVHFCKKKLSSLLKYYVYRNFSLPIVLYIQYWSNFSRFPLIADNMFQFLFHYIHFNENTQKNLDIISIIIHSAKVSPLLKQLRDAMARIELEERHSVD